MTKNKWQKLTFYFLTINIIFILSKKIIFLFVFIFVNFVAVNLTINLHNLK